jgi:hypothetical protein
VALVFVLPMLTCVVCTNSQARARGLGFCATNVDMCGLHKLTSESTWPWCLCYFARAQPFYGLGLSFY